MAGMIVTWLQKTEKLRIPWALARISVSAVGFTNLTHGKADVDQDPVADPEIQIAVPVHEAGPRLA